VRYYNKGAKSTSFLFLPWKMAKTVVVIVVIDDFINLIKVTVNGLTAQAISSPGADGAYPRSSVFSQTPVENVKTKHSASRGVPFTSRVLPTPKLYCLMVGIHYGCTGVCAADNFIEGQ